MTGDFDQKAIEVMAVPIKRRNGCDTHEGCEDPRRKGGCACRDDATAALAAYRQFQQEAGVVEVPREPTGAMVVAGVNYRLRTSIGGDNYWEKDTATLYQIMLAAAQETKG